MKSRVNNKRKIIVLYKQDSNNPKNTWSGTSYQLKEALKEYFDVVFVDANDNKLLGCIKSISSIIEKKTKSILIKPLYEYLHKCFINYKLKEYKHVPVLEISENVDINNDYYLYRDMAYACYPYVLEKFENDGNDYGRGMLRHISKKALIKRMDNEKILIKRSKCNFFMGQWNVDLLNNKYPCYADKFISVGGGINNELNCKISASNKKRILFVGIDFLRKGGDVVAAAYKILKEKYDKDVELIIAGADYKSCEEGITCLGKLNRDELSKVFSTSSVFCMPSRFEAYGLVFLEAQCYGLPIIAYDDYEMHYFVKEGINGYLIKEHSAEELAETLHKALNNKKMINYMRENAISFKDQHSWDAVAKKIAGVINERSYGE